MRGKHVFFETLALHGIEHIFGNPGTTESPLMDQLIDDCPVRYVTALQESVALGAAHFFAHAAGSVSVVNLHVAPGLGNGLGMLYNASEANSPMLITAGQQDTRMRLREPLLSGDLVAMARPLVKWSVQAERADELGPLLHRALKIATDPDPGPVFVALPIDVLEQETRVPAQAPGKLFRQPPPDPTGLEQIADALRQSRHPAIVVGDGISRSGAVTELVALSELLAAPVFFEGLVQQLNFPTRHPHWRPRMPLNHSGIQQALASSDVVLLIGGSFFEEVWFDDCSPFPDGARVLQIESAPHRLSHNMPLQVGLTADPRLAIQGLLEILQQGDLDRAARTQRAAALAQASERERQAFEKRAERQSKSGLMTSAHVMRELASALPENGIVVNEAITGGGDLMAAFDLSRPDQYYGIRGGGIGQGLPGALGVSLGSPDRPVLCLSGDGSAMYSIQALWTAAQHKLPILFVILHNREYRILKINMDSYRERFGVPADRPYPHMNLSEPELDFVEMAAGMGVKGRKIERPETLRPAIDEALESGEPRLLDVMIEGQR